MKKKEIVLVIMMGILTVGVIVFGFIYSRNQREELANSHDYEEISQADSFDERKKKKEEERRAAFLAAFDEKREESTVADFLQYVKYGKGDTAITFFGEVEQDAAWIVDNMNALSNERLFSEMSMNFVSTLDSEEDLEIKTEELVATEPDVVFYFAPLPINEIVDWTWEGEPIEENNVNEIFTAYDLMKQSLPETLVVLVTPPPAESYESEEGTVSYHQTEIDEMIAISEEHGLPVYNLHNQVMTHLTENQLSIESLYGENGELTEESRQLVTDFFFNNLKELKVNTTTAYYLEGDPAEVDIVFDEVLEEEESAEEIIEEESSEEWSEEEVIEEDWSEEEYVEEEEVDWGWEPPVEEESTWTPPVVNPTPPTNLTPPNPEPEPNPQPDPEVPSTPEPTPDPEPEESESESSSESELPPEPVEGSDQ